MSSTSITLFICHTNTLPIFFFSLCLHNSQVQNTLSSFMKNLFMNTFSVSNYSKDILGFAICSSILKDCMHFFFLKPSLILYSLNRHLVFLYGQSFSKYAHFNSLSFVIYLSIGGVLNHNTRLPSL